MCHQRACGGQGVPPGAGGPGKAAAITAEQRDLLAGEASL